MERIGVCANAVSPSVRFPRAAAAASSSSSSSSFSSSSLVVCRSPSSIGAVCSSSASSRSDKHHPPLSPLPFLLPLAAAGPLNVAAASAADAETGNPSSASPCSDKHHSPLSLLPFLLPLAAAGFLNAAAASVADAETSKNLVEGFLSQEPANALSLPTWTIHVASVVEWAVAMALVWRFGDNPKNAAWKGLTWGMILVVLQAALTMIGNFTMWLAAYRIYRSSSKSY